MKTSVAFCPWKRALLPAALVFLLAVAAAPRAVASTGRVQASNLLLYQVGHDPGSQDNEGTRFFDHVQLDYLSGVFRYGLRADFYRTSEAGQVYEDITQKFIEWRSPNLQVRVGNAYATIGHGLLFRAFELPGVVREVNTITDSKYADSRDLDGAVVQGRYGPVRFQALTGRPLAYPDNPPGLDFLVRRDGTVSGGHVDVDVGRGVTIGSGYMRAEGFDFTGDSRRQEYAEFDLTLDAARLVPGLTDAGGDLRLYAEYAARHWTPFADPFSTADDDPHGLYASAALAFGRWSLTYEAKDYRDFSLPFNDPPNLVPELTPSLVSRRSHFLIADDERGRLIGLQGAAWRDWLVRFEHADARTGDDPNRKEYRLNYLELAAPPLAETRGSLFVAEGRDDLEALAGHKTVGGSLERSLPGGFAAAGEIEYQQVERPFGVGKPDEVLVSLTVSKAGTGSISLVWEQSNDPQLTDDPLTLDIETGSRRWFGAIVQGTLDASHEATLFAGKRRGGTACTSGTCYLVPDFDGVEVRLTSRF